MTQNFNEDTLLPFPSNETSSGKSDAAPKRVAKKAAKKAAKKVAAEVMESAPAVAKKAAKKAVKKVIVTEVAAPAPAAEAPAKKAAKKAAPRAAKVVAEISGEDVPKPKPTSRAKTVAEPVREREERPEPRQETPAPQAPSEDGQQQRFGRVPGGGRVQHRGPEGPPREPQQQQAPQQREQGPHGQHQQPRHPQQHPPQGQGGQQESRSKRRREKRKRRRDRQFSGDQPRPDGENQNPGPGPRQGPPNPHQQHEQAERRPPPPQFSGPKVEVNGMLELAPKGFGFLRLPAKRFEQARDDVFVSPEHVRKFGLRVGHWIHGIAQEGPRGPQLIEITSVNGLDPDISRKLPLFEELKAINPTKRISFETTPERFTTRVVDLMAPVGRGQRGLIVSPPRSGKTTLLLHMAEAIREKYEETMHLMIVLVDERPEEVTEFRRALPGVEIYASSNDDGSRNHCRIAELAIERAKRLVEGGKDVFLLMDSITRLARAYNHGGGGGGHNRGIASGGLMVGALEIPRRLFAAARNTRGGGSLTILATALIQTNSKADEAIFQEFKGTGNMELVLDRKIAENYIYPAVDIFKSGTRREELLLPEHMLHKIYLIRRGLSGHRPVEAMERLLFFLKKFPNNPQMLMEIKG